MENYKCTADLRHSSCLLLKLFNRINEGIKLEKPNSKFIVQIGGDYPLLLVQLSILPLPKANNIPLKAPVSLRRGKNPPGEQFREVKFGSGSGLPF